MDTYFRYLKPNKALLSLQKMQNRPLLVTLETYAHRTRNSIVGWEISRRH